MQEIVKAGPAVLPPAGLRRRGPGRAGRRAVQAGADRPQGRGRGHRGRLGRGRRRRADHLRQPRRADRRPGLDRPVPRPAPADHPADPGVQADAHRPRRTGAGARRTRSCSGSTAPRGRPGTRSRSYLRLLERGREARPPQARRRARPVQLPRRDRLRPGGLPPEGRHHPPGDGGLLAAAGTRRPATTSSTPRTSPRASCSRSPATWTGTPTACSRRCELRGRADYYLKPMNCPMHNLIFRARGPVLPRAAAAAVRVRHRLPVREVRRRARPDPGARHDPGRRAHLLHPGADRRRAARRCSPSCSTCCATTASTTSTWSCPPATRRSSSAPTRTGRRRPRPCAEVADGVRARARARPGRRRVLRAEDLRAGPGRDRPDLADVDHPAGLQPAGAVRAGVPGRGRRRGSGR